MSKIELNSSSTKHSIEVETFEQAYKIYLLERYFININ